MIYLSKIAANTVAFLLNKGPGLNHGSIEIQMNTRFSRISTVMPPVPLDKKRLVEEDIYRIASGLITSNTQGAL